MATTEHVGKETASGATDDDLAEEIDDAWLKKLGQSFFPPVAEGDEYMRYIKHSESYVNNASLVPVRVISITILATSFAAASTTPAPDSMLAAGAIVLCLG